MDKDLKKIHQGVYKYLKTKKADAEVEEFSEFPNKYGANVSDFIVKYNIQDKYNYDVQRIKIEHSINIVFIPNRGYFSFKNLKDIKNIIDTESELKK
jgi:hypothetical protein